MTQHITVRFDEDREYDFRVHDSALTFDDARRWLDEQFAATGIEPLNPMGKALAVDKVLAVARAYGPKSFADRSDLALRFVSCAAAVIGRPNITVDVERTTVGF